MISLLFCQENLPAVKGLFLLGLKQPAKTVGAVDWIDFLSDSVIVNGILDRKNQEQVSLYLFL
ncbi:hypothetical protein, partial [Marinilabilia sp.]|uniref:hypothetical protein n=1 Tax=Marinilabilia sp. TaxID=2021252 RepID=UPI0025C10425